MSLQNAVNKFLSDSGSNLRTITVIGETGDLILPDRCYLLLRGCNVGKLVIGKYCVVVIEQSKLLKEVDIDSFCTITIDATAVSDIVNIKDSKGTFKNCAFNKTVTINGTSIDSYVCSFAGMGPGMALDKGCNITVRGCSFTSDTGVTVSGDSQLNLYNVNFATNKECITSTTAVVNYYGGVMSSGNGTCISGVKNSKIAVSNIASAFGQIGVINIDSGTVMQVHNSGGFNTQNNTIVVNGTATLDIYQVASLISILTVLSITNGGKLTISEVPLIYSNKADAIHMDNGTLFGRGLGTIRGTTSAFVTQNSCLVRLLGFTEIRADKDICINTGDSDSYELTNGNLIQADKGDLITGTNGHLVLRDVSQIFGELKGGILMGDNAQVEIFNAQEIKAMTTATVQVGDNGQILLSFCPLVHTLGSGDTCVTGDNGFFRATDCGTILSLKQNAITAGVGTSLEIVGFTNIQSMLQYAMDIDGCYLTLRGGGQVLGGKQGGIKIGGSGGTVDMEQVALVDGGLGEALYVNNGIVNIQDCAAFNGGSNALHLDGGTVANVAKLKTVVGQTSGLVVHNGSNLTINGSDLIQGSSGPALDFDSSEVNMVGVTKATSPDLALQVANNSKVSIRGTTLDGGNVSTADSDLQLLSCVIKNDFTSTNTNLDFNRCDFQGMFTVTGGILDAQNTNVKGKAIITTATLKYTLVGHQDLVTMTGCAGFFISSQATSWVNIEGAILSVGCGGAFSNAPPGSYLDIQKGGLINAQGLVFAAGLDVELA